MPKQNKKIDDYSISIKKAESEKSIVIEEGKVILSVPLDQKTIYAKDVFSSFFNHGIYSNYCIVGEKIPVPEGKSLSSIDNLFNDCIDLFNKISAQINAKAKEFVDNEEKSGEGESDLES